MNKTVLISFAFVLFFYLTLSGQDAPNFTVTDSDGYVHMLHEDYLDQGKTVVIKIFFVNCPPCHAIAPSFQQLYEDWGEGQEDVQFFELSNKTFDSNDDVGQYHMEAGLTFPGVGNDGGALTALQPYINGTYGSFFGTPTFVVIAPDRSVNYNVNGPGIQGDIDAINAAIEATGATGGEEEEEEEEEEMLPSSYTISVQDLFNNPVSNYNLILTSSLNPNVEYPITLDNANIFSITDLASEYPNIQDPIIKIRKNTDVKDRLSAIDLLIIMRHILGVDILTNELLKIAADTNGDGSISAIDLITLQRIILGVTTEFPGVDAYSFDPQELPLSIVPGGNQTLNIRAIKIGDLNGF